MNTIWKDLIQHLTRKGETQYTMAKAAGVDQSTICRLAGGRHEPRFGVGMALIKLGGGVDALRLEGLTFDDVAANDSNAAQPTERGVLNA